MSELTPNQPKAALHVAYDEECRLCMGFAQLISRCDHKRRIVVDAAHHPRHEKLKVAPDRLSALVAWDEEHDRYLFGFAAVAAILRRLPGGLLAAPILWLFTRTGWGDRLYAKVASKRACSKS